MDNSEASNSKGNQSRANSPTHGIANGVLSQIREMTKLDNFETNVAVLDSLKDEASSTRETSLSEMEEENKKLEISNDETVILHTSQTLFETPVHSHVDTNVLRVYYHNSWLQNITSETRATNCKVYKLSIDEHGDFAYPRPLEEDPMGCYKFPRITRSIRGQFPDLRYYNFPNGNEGIESFPPSYRIPEWQAHAGWLGPRPFFRVKWGSPYPFQPSSVLESNGNRSRRARFASKPVIPKSFRCDHMPHYHYVFPLNMPLYCRELTVFNHNTVSEYNGDGSSFHRDASSSSLSNNQPEDLVIPFISRVALKVNQPFDMFPGIPTWFFQSMLNNYYLPIGLLTFADFLLLAMYRCIELHLLGERDGLVKDNIDLMLHIGLVAFFNHLVNSEDTDEESVEIDIELD